MQQLQPNFQKLKSLIQVVNNVIQPLRKNMYNYLNDKHNNKLDPSIDYITQDDGVRYQQQKVLDLFKRSLYYFENIQFDYHDQFWDKIKRITTVDFSLLQMQQKAQIYKSVYHMILQYQARILEQQKLAFKQKQQAQRIKRITRAKQLQQQKKQQKQKQQEAKRKAEQQQLLQAFDKATQIIQISFDKMLAKLGKTKKVAYEISKKRRLEKTRQQKRQAYTHKKTHSTGITHPRKPSKPRKPKTGRKY